MMVLLPSLLVILTGLSGSFGLEDLQKKVFVFPAANKKAAVQLDVSLPHPVTDFTACVRFNPLQFRPYTLFSYTAKPSGQGFRIVKPNPGQFNLQIGGMTQIIAPGKVSHADWQHICAAWSSATGLVYFWHNGVLLPRFVMKQGYQIGPRGTVLLGHDPDSWGRRECFLGEMADVNMWLQVLKPDEMNLVSKNNQVPGSVVSWRALNYSVQGGVRDEAALYEIS